MTGETVGTARTRTVEIAVIPFEVAVPARDHAVAASAVILKAEEPGGRPSPSTAHCRDRVVVPYAGIVREGQAPECQLRGIVSYSHCRPTAVIVRK